MRTRKLPPEEKRCQMSAGTAEQCRAPRRKNSEYCFFHAPEAQDQRVALGEKLLTLQWLNHSDLHQFLVEATEAVRRKRLDPQRAYALACLVKMIRENLPAVDRELREHQQMGYVGWTPEVVEKLAWQEVEEEEKRTTESESKENGEE